MDSVVKPKNVTAKLSPSYVLALAQFLEQRKKDIGCLCSGDWTDGTSHCQECGLEKK